MPVTPVITTSSSTIATTDSTPSMRAPHGIQGLDLLGRKVLLDRGRALGLLVARITQTAERATAAGGSGEGYAAKPSR